ncbi:MAG: T9SS type A sorting domain-containing protein, partial [Duncaniella sp.]|nr:T9SS type A sorting domain-containing protein [Duncaniella sp.]
DTTWGDRMAETGITDNYALAPLAVIDPALEASLDNVEGETLAAGNADTEFFEGLGFKFNGYSAAEPWVFNSTLPALYFENTVGAALYFDPASVSVVEGEKEYVMLILENVQPDALSIESSDESGCYLNPVEVDEDGNVVCEVVCLKTGTYTITATNGTVSATLTVTGTSSIAEIAGESKSAIVYDGSSVSAPGCDITIYSVTGIEVARGHGKLSAASLVPGVYVAKATGNEATGTLKFVVR